ncbi:MAG: hypothetical protein MJ051_05170 [Akkermansia sp.]|nr:hypothetical protein [Akkermansia sp.]
MLATALYAVENCPDGVCSLPAEPQEGVYAVYAPVGRSHIKEMRQGPRLDTLDGKTIAVVGGSFMAYVTHPEIKKLIQSHYKNTTVYVLNEIGSAGPWPGPGVVREQKDAFVGKLKSMGVDAVISGNGGCGLCTPKEMGSCIAAESIGLASVMIAAPGFTEQAKSAARAAGVAIPRVAEYPGAFSAHTPEELKKNTREVLWPQIVKALTTPFSDAERVKNEGAQTGVVLTGSLEAVNEHFAEKGWTDGLPIVPPTKEAVEEFLRFTDAAADSVVATVAPAQREVTVRQVAVNGVMAGCPPEYMPLLIAMTKAMTDGDFRRTLASTHAWTPFCWVNGPVARQLGLDHGQGEISDQRNAKLGRFINLAMLNFGGYYIKENRMGTFGYLMPWCLAEDEAAAVKLGWLPYHMQQGYQLNDNTLSVGSALCWGNNLAPATSDAEKIMEMMAWDATEKQQFAVGSGTPFVYRTMLITEYVARDLAQKYKSKEELEKALLQTARVPLVQRATANYWGNPGSAFNPETYPLSQHVRKIARTEGAEETRTPLWLQWSGKDTVQTVPVMQEGKTAMLITGDDNRNKTMCLPGGGFATVKIELPKNWDKLMEEKGYAPLASFELKSNLKPHAPHPNASRYHRGKGMQPASAESDAEGEAHAADPRMQRRPPQYRRPQGGGNGGYRRPQGGQGGFPGRSPWNR